MSPREPIPALEGAQGGRPVRLVVTVLAALATLLPVAFHRAYISGEAILYQADVAQLQFPRYVTLCEALARRDFPLWQTLVYGGSPFHANPENPTLYPPTLLFAALATPIWTINLTILVHLALAGLGMFALVWRLGRRMPLAPGPLAAGALVASVTFTLNHFMRRDHVNLVAYGAAHAWIPWMLLAADGVLNGARPSRSAGWLALCVAAIFFTGGLYVIPYACLALALWMLLLGVGGDREARARTLRYGTLAAVAAVLLVAAKLLPYLEWLPTTNRTGRLPLDEALGTALGMGEGGVPFVWSGVATRGGQFLGGAWVLLPGLLALALWRERVVRVVLGMALLGFLIALGGRTWRLLYECVPPFDQIRSAVRAWTLVNAFFPLLAGLGTAWLLSRFATLRASVTAAAGLGVLIAGALITQLIDSDPRDHLLWNPQKHSELLELTPRWREAAERAGTRWRVAWLEIGEPVAHNEQFVTSSLGLETVIGYQGHVWPARQEVFLYGPAGARIDRRTRMRRLGALSVKWMVENQPGVVPPRDPKLTAPPGLDGTDLLENPHARPRAFLPAVTVGVIDDELGDLARRVLDHPRFPIAEAALISLPWSRDLQGPRASDAELAALDLVLVQGPLNAMEEYGPIRERLRSPQDLRTLGVQLDESALKGYVDELVDDIAARALTRRTVELALEREGGNRALVHVLAVDQGAGERGRFAVLSEPWAWYPGWEIEGMVEAPKLRIAEGISTAFLLPAGTKHSPLVARYQPRSFTAGLTWGALGLALALGLVLVPHRAGSAHQRGA
jgi:hypothetical protein